MRYHLKTTRYTALLLAMSLVVSLALSAAATPSGESAKILSVVDGDTITVDLHGKRQRLRLIGIDTPESRLNKRTKTQAARTHTDSRTILQMGAHASAYTKRLLPAGTAIRIEYDVEQFDRYGRLLGYVWLPNGTMVNEEIVRAGYAYILTIPPNIKYRERFAAAFRESRENQRGLWSPSP